MRSTVYFYHDNTICRCKMTTSCSFAFKSRIYRIGINLVVNVPKKVTDKLLATKGLIKIRGTINGFSFHTTLMPVKNKLYILYVNIPMLKGAVLKEGDMGSFSIRQDLTSYEQHYPMPATLTEALKKTKLEEQFSALTEARKKDILKYLNGIKTNTTLEKHITTLVKKLRDNEKNIRIPS